MRKLAIPQTIDKLIFDTLFEKDKNQNIKFKDEISDYDKIECVGVLVAWSQEIIKNMQIKTREGIIKQAIELDLVKASTEFEEGVEIGDMVIEKEMLKTARIDDDVDVTVFNFASALLETDYVTVALCHVCKQKAKYITNDGFVCEEHYFGKPKEDEPSNETEDSINNETEEECQHQ